MLSYTIRYISVGSLVTTAGEYIAATGQYTDFTDGNAAAAGKDAASLDEYTISTNGDRVRPQAVLLRLSSG